MLPAILNAARAEELLTRFREARLAVMGDFCLDAYWTLDGGEAEISVETGLPTRAVRQQRYSPGGAGNIASNMVSLGVAEVRAVGVAGEDMHGREMLRLLERKGINASGLVRSTDWQTAVYAKSYLDRQECERIDFGRFNEVTRDIEEELLLAIRRAAEESDFLVVNQQLSRDFYTPRLTALLGEIAREGRVLFDTRDRQRDFRGGIVKCNAREAMRAAGEQATSENGVPLEDVRRCAKKLFENDPRPVVITRGSRGIYAYDGETEAMTPGVQHLRPVDTVGAGDTVAACLAAAFAGECKLSEAIALANLASAVTVRAIGDTGAASPGDIAEMAANANYCFRPERADDPRRAEFLPGCPQIEILDSTVELGGFTHAIFDHDGTISTLREGWETVMEPVMVRAILGRAEKTASLSEMEKVRESVCDFIDRSTGVQTIVQMQGLVEMVREAGYVPEEEILSPAGYKEIYNDALMEFVTARRRRVEAGELDAGDFTVKGSVEFVRQLHGAGLTLYMASGTDEPDVIAEAELLGYAHYFEGGIYGAVGDVARYSKKMVIERILRENGLRGSQLICFGDGPVEMRETKRAGGVAVGIASDELRRHGLNDAKRKRLVLAGSDVIVPDFSVGPQLLDYLRARESPRPEPMRQAP